MTAPSVREPAGSFRTDAEAVLFGFPPERVAVTLQPRSRGWRIAGAARSLAIAVVVAPMVAVIPPHAPWAIGALAAGGILARRRWTEQHTLLALEGRCPKCGEALHVRGGRLRHPHPLTCEACHHASTLSLPDGALDGGQGG